MKMFTFNPGDLLFRPEGLYQHIGVYIGWGRVLQNTVEKGEHVSDVHQFSRGQKIGFKKTSSNVSAVLSRAEAKIRNPKPYHILNNNCEHTAYEVAEGHRNSPQLWFWLAVGLLAVIYFTCRSR